ncbi:hypothetical protein EVB87_040 [Rhizobium phage RHph_N28_1]|nr:hypothetical protein EVB87_040 [Rhizobium phage RHph_N28_1]QIG74068.1 hypothetical protein EVC07_040 [Rhizobium phage RHph_N42]
MSYFDTWQEHCDYEANAPYDYLSEAYGETARDANRFAEDEERFYNMLANTIGPLPEIYVSMHSADAWYEMEALNAKRVAEEEACMEAYSAAMQAWALGGCNPEDKPLAPGETGRYDFDLPF